MLTVKDLYEEMKKRMENGEGDYVVFVTDDEEANGYHALFYKGATPNEMDEEDLEYCEENNHDIDALEDNKKAVYIG